MKKFKQLLALMLAVTMLAGLVPANVMPVEAKPGKPGTEEQAQVETLAVEKESRDASEIVDAAIFFSDLHSMYKGDNTEGSKGYKKEVVTNIMTTLKNTGLTFSSVTSVGDAFSSNETAYTGKTSIITGYIRNALGNQNIPVNYTWSDHDRAALAENDKDLLENKSGLIYGAGEDGIYGNEDDGNYYIYAISMSDTSSAERYNQPSTFTTQKLQDFKDAVEDLDTSKPLFIASHQPLLARRGDNQYGYQWCTAINEVAEKRDVAFFFGHNHKYDKAEDYYYDKGDTMTVQDGSSTKSVELNFTHMCTGYLDPATTNSISASTTRQGTVMLVTIYDDEINYTTYSASGEYTGSYAVNEMVKRDHAVIEQPVEKGALEEAITAAEALNAEDYIDFTAVAEALAAAKAVAEDENATQEAVDAAVAALNTAVDALEIKPEDTEIPEDYTLERIEVVNTGVTKYFLGAELDASGLKVEAVYTKENEIDKRIKISPVSESNPDGYVISGYDMEKVGKQYITVTYENCVGSFAIEVFQKAFTNNTGDVTVDFSNHGITSMEATSEVKEVTGYSAYVTYDITPVGYTQGDEATVSVAVDTTLFDVARPVNVLDQGKCIATTNIVDGRVTFTTNHFSEYDIVQVDATSLTWEYFTTTEATTYYELTDSIKDGETYLIVSASSGSAYMLNDSGKSQSVTIDNGVITAATAQNTIYHWKFTGSDSTYSIQNVNTSRYLYPHAKYSNGFWVIGAGWNYELVSNGTSENSVQIACLNDNVVQIYRNVIDGNRNTTSYIRYNNNSFTASNTAGNLYLFQKIDVPGTDIYTAIDGKLQYNILTGTYDDLDAVLDMIRSNITVYTASDANGTNQSDPVAYTLEVKEGTLDPSKEGTTTLSLKYNGEEIKEITVNVITKVVTSITVNPKEFTVERGAAKDTKIGTITVTYEDQDIENIDLTLGMLQGDYNVNKNGTYTELSVSYGGQTLENLTLKVVNKTGVDDFPTYPTPGSVDLKKSATGVDFQNTGVARVELSASGLPYSKGVDVIVMLDMSSSMERCIAHDDKNHVESCQTREEELSKAVKNFITTLQQSKNADNIRVAIADFNGISTSSTPYRLDDCDRGIGTDFNPPFNAKVYTDNSGDGALLDADAFVKANELKITDYEVDDFTPKQGTNYDYAFDAIYQLGSAIKDKNAADKVERDLYVLFMSDGAPNQYNYYGSIGGDVSYAGSVYWDFWLNGKMGTIDPETNKTINMTDVVSCTDHAYYYDSTNGNQHRMANAVKGNQNQYYEVIRKTSTDELSKKLKPLDETSANYGKDNMYNLAGLGATMYSIAFDPADDGPIPADAMIHILKNYIPSSEEYYFEATKEGELQTAFEEISSHIAYAATNARYVDQMGSNFNLLMNPTVKTNATGSGGTREVNTTIQITTRPVYTKDDVEKDENLTNEDIGKPYGTGTIIETVTFTPDENGQITATTDADGYTLPNDIKVEKDMTQILVNGIIYGKNFFYNTTTSEKTITLADGSTYKLPAETFYWNIGTINEVQYTMSYTVYLDGSMDGVTQPGSYETNNFAILYYTNHEENEVSKSVVSPSLAWEGAQVSYAFYLVNDKGEPVYADGTYADNFLQAYKITQPVVYKSINLNNETSISAEAVAVLPSGYTLYAPDATYKIEIASGDGNAANENRWTITGDEDKTTYVIGYSDNVNDYTNEQTVENSSYDYTHTTVYFAVVWTIGTVPDTVVIDYGLDVDINVLANDMFGADGTLTGVGVKASKPSGRTDMMVNGFDSRIEGTFGTATVKDGKVRYSLDKINGMGMQMNDAETLAYAVDYEREGSGHNGYYYGDLTIIPATTVYYEDEYVKLTTYTKSTTSPTEIIETPGWPRNSTAAIEIQGEDRPGQFNLGVIDANNIYGFDSAYANMSSFSMNNAAMIHVDDKQYGTAEFEFYGTGFDVVSATSNTTGTLVVQVYACNENGTPNASPLKSQAVDTYYGYVYGLYEVVYEKVNGVWEKVSVGDEQPEGTPIQTKEDLTPIENENGTITGTITHYTWKAVNNDPNALYQVPVMKVDGLAYGKYYVKITALHYDVFDSTEEPGYDLYLDAIRIYNPAGEFKSTDDLNTTIGKAYAADGEFNPNYYELRNILIKASTIKNLSNSEVAEGIVFIDGNEALTNESSVTKDAVKDYENYGPNNEVYLAVGQAVAFDFHVPKEDGYSTIVRIGMKTVGGATAHAKLWNVGKKVTDGKVEYVEYNTISKSINSATDMYYDISTLNGGTIVIANTGEEGSILSITNVKTSYKPEVTSTSGLSDNLATENVSNSMMFSVSRASVDAAVLSLAQVTEEDESEVNVPEVDEPEIDEPELNEPEINEPGNSKPMVPTPEEIIETVVNTIVETVKNVLSNLFNRWFR